MAAEEESARTVAVAIGTNLLVAVGKAAAGALGHSAAMLSEAAHSVADTANEVLLLAAIRRSGHPPDARHPFGYGRARYFWSLLAAVGIFVGGGVFAVQVGIRGLLDPGPDEGHYALSYGVLAGAMCLESVSWVRAYRQLRAQAVRRGRRLREELWRTTDPTPAAVLLEDSAAVIGIGVAAAGLAGRQVTGSPVPDAVASIAVGLLLAGVALALGRRNASLIVGEAADPQLRETAARVVTSYPGIRRLDELLTSVIGSGEVFVAARVDLRDDMLTSELEAMSRSMERELMDRDPRIRYFFLDVTGDAPAR